MRKLVNDFLIGADPELVLLDPPRLVNAMQYGNKAENFGFYGFDHGGYILEPHPTPAFSARDVCHNIRACLDFTASTRLGKLKARAGAVYEDAEVRTVTLGGHVHIDKRELTVNQVKAMDVFTASLVHLDILPKNECQIRSACAAGYGKLGDVRNEHGHCEYRSMCSWLFSRKTAMLCLTGIKLCTVDPDIGKRFDSIKALTNWLEKFRAQDDDARWILEHDYFGKSMEADPSASVFGAWKSDPTRGKDLATLAIKEKAGVKVANVVAQAQANRPNRFDIQNVPFV
jgi:hypothetical protein